MNTLAGSLLGTIQGLTEFLPISSSGHLVLFQNLMGLREPELLLDVCLHLGTLLAVCIYFRSDLVLMTRESLGFASALLQGRARPAEIRRNPYAYLTLWVLVGTLPTLVIGLTFRSPLEGLFGSVPVVGAMLAVTGLMLAVTWFLPARGKGPRALGLGVALAVGTAQGLAIIPGISRSGATIVCGMLFGLERDLAARFSFLLSIPAIVGALVLQVAAGAPNGAGLPALSAGFVCALLVGLVALKVLMGMVRKGRLYAFAPYCWALALVIFLLP